MERITPHLLMRGFALPAMTEALDPHDWPLFPSAKVIVARNGDASEALGWGRRIREAYALPLEAALEQAPYATLVVDARRVLILPFELIDAELAEKEEDEPPSLFNPRETPVAVKSVPTPEEEVFLREHLA